MPKIFIIIAAIIILISVIVFAVININKEYQSNKKTRAKNILYMLLKTNSVNFTKNLRKIIDELDMERFSAFSDGGDKYLAIKDYVNAQFIDSSYNLILNIVNESFKNKVINKGLYMIIIERLTPELIRDYTLDLFDDATIQDLMIDIYNKCIADKVEQIEMEDQRINEEYWIPSEEEVEVERSIEDNNAIIDKYTQEHHLNEVSNYDFEIDKRLLNSFDDEEINPPKEEESNVIEDDGSIEIIEWIGDK